MKKILVSCSVVFLLNLFLWGISFTSFENFLHPVHSGIPAIFRKDVEYWSRISTPVVTSSRLYLLYDSLSIIKVYDLTGNYLYSINFSTIRHRGTSQLYAVGDELFFQNGGQSGFYHFKSDEFVDFYPDDTIEDIGVDLPTHRSDYRSETDCDGNCYRIEGASIIKEDPNGIESVLIHRASWLQLYQNNSFLIIMIVAFFCMVLVIKHQW